MARRNLDQYPTEARLTRSLLKRVRIYGDIFEPCAGAGLMSQELAHHNVSPYSRFVQTNDIDPQYQCDWNCDATDPAAPFWGPGKYNWAVTNPPFTLAFPILQNALGSVRDGVAFLLRLSFLEPTFERAEWFIRYQDHISHIMIFGSPRPSYNDSPNPTYSPVQQLGFGFAATEEPKKNGSTDSVTTAWIVWRPKPANGAKIRFINDWREA